MRWIKHLFLDDFAVRRAFPREALQAIESAIASQEQRHRGELRFVVEGGLPLVPFLAGRTAHERAIDLFSHLDRQIDIEPLRGIHLSSPAAEQ